MKEENIIDKLLTGSELLQCYDNTDLFLGKPAKLNGKDLPKTEISDDGKTLKYCGIIIRENDGLKPGRSASLEDDYTYDGLTSDELREMGKKNQ